MNERAKTGPGVIDGANGWLLLFAVLSLALAMDPPFGFPSDVAGVVAGAFIGLLISRYYSQRASEELEHQAANLLRETDKLRWHGELIMQALEEADLVAYARNERGEIVGITIRGTISITPTTSVDVAARTRDQGGEDATTENRNDEG